MSDIFYNPSFADTSQTMSLREYLEECKTNPIVHASAAERMISAIGKPEIFDTSKDARFGRIFFNKTIKIYPTFSEFFGMEETLERLVNYFSYSAQGLEERKQILYLLGPAGSAKSTIAEKLKMLMEEHSIYVLKSNDHLSPIFETPLGIFSPKHTKELSSKYHIPEFKLSGIMSPWAAKRLHEFDGDLSKFTVQKITPSKISQIAITKVEPGDENNQDISNLVGKVDLRKLELHAQNNPDAYSYSGGLNRSNQGILEFVEMFKAPIKMLHPLLTATQEGNYIGTENIGAIPFSGVILAHCFSEDTELLTSDGWKHHSDISLSDDMLATMNKETGYLRLQPILKKFEQDYVGDMYHLSSPLADHLVTPNHKMIYKSQDANSWEECLAKEFKIGKIIPAIIGETKTETTIDSYEKIHYEGKVFCFETENHTLVARRNGKVIITGNSNEAEWLTFRNKRENEAFIDRIYVIKVPYCLRYTDEQKIYEKMLGQSDLVEAPCAPGTLEFLAKFSVMTRLKDHENSNKFLKMRIYNGENLKETDPNAKSMNEYKETAGIDEGMTGSSTRFAFKALSSAYNFDSEEVAADPIHLIYVLEQAIKREALAPEKEKEYLDYIETTLRVKYAEFLEKEIQQSYIESYSDYGQNVFDRYISYADAWIEDTEYKDPDTGQMMNRDILNNELTKIEKPVNISNVKDFRNEVVKFALRYRAQHNGDNPRWTEYNKIKEVIEKKMFASLEEMLPVISFGSKKETELDKKHSEFVIRMQKKGYTPKQVRRMVEWFSRYRKSN